jgi:hypothetical protein
VIRWFRRLRWPLRDPAIREARDDYRDALAAIRLQMEQRVDELERDNAQLRTALATALLSEHMYRGQARRPRVDPERTQITPASMFRRPR